MCLKWILLCLERVSGVKATLEKSEPVPEGNVPNVDLLTSQFGYRVGKLPTASNCSGLPLGDPFKSY